MLDDVSGSVDHNDRITGSPRQRTIRLIASAEFPPKFIWGEIGAATAATLEPYPRPESLEVETIDNPNYTDRIRELRMFTKEFDQGTL